MPVRFLTGISNYFSNYARYVNSRITKYAGIGPMQGLETNNLTSNLFVFKEKKEDKGKFKVN